MSKIKMPKLFRTKWLNALRSGRYNQVMYNLHGKNGNCCLGVAGRILRVPLKQLENYGTPAYTPNPSKFPECLVRVSKTGSAKDTPFTDKLIQMNDGDGKNFEQIADYIEKKTVGV